ncbi:hypothetical protein N9H45_07955 [Opitutales bacterium]|nr:hypothetical protein [Opitutales bacterium]
MDLRDTIFEQFVEFAKVDKKTIILVNDQAAFTLNKFREEFPNQYINVGIAEQNIMNVATGLSLSGFKVYAYGITNFMSIRCADQLYTNLSCMNLPITIIASGGGLTYATGGPTHHATIDINLIRSFPNFTIYNPCDEITTRMALLQSQKSKGPLYIRLEKGTFTSMHANDIKPEDSFSEIIEGEKLAVVSTGHISHQVKNVCESLISKGHSVGFFDIFRIKPFSHDAFNEIIKKYHKVAIVEEQTPFGGIYEQVQSSLMEYRNFKEIKQFSLPDKPIYDYGSREWIRGKYKLGADYLYGEFKEFLTRDL